MARTVIIVVVVIVVVLLLLRLLQDPRPGLCGAPAFILSWAALFEAPWRGLCFVPSQRCAQPQVVRV
jgi:hypothetical protein